MEKLPGDYIAGFVDGEGCFALKFVREVRYDRKNKPEYLYWDIEFAILLRQDDQDILKGICETLGVGRISISKNGGARYAVNKINELQDVIVPFFEKYSLRAKKRFDFALWKKALIILEKNQQKKIIRKEKQGGFLKTQLSASDIDELHRIHEQMKAYKSAGKEWKWLPRRQVT